MSDDVSKRPDDPENVTSEDEGDAVHASVEAEVVSDEPAPAPADVPADDGAPSEHVPDSGASHGRSTEAEHAGELSKEHKQWGMFCHLAGLAGFIVPFGGIIGPLILWQMKKDESPFIDDQGKEALNFNIAAAVLITVVSTVAAVGMLFFIGVLLIPVIFVLTIGWVAYAVIAGIKASEGVAYRYPWTFRFLK